MAEPVELSGEGSRAREVEMPHGDYRLTWTAQGSGGRHVVSVEADGLSWRITFTQL
jgi:hypothetical protein